MIPKGISDKSSLLGGSSIQKMALCIKEKGLSTSCGWGGFPSAGLVNDTTIDDVHHQNILVFLFPLAPKNNAIVLSILTNYLFPLLGPYEPTAANCSVASNSQILP
jgi:hypothetical protein